MGATSIYNKSGELLNPSEKEKAEINWLIEKGNSYQLEHKAHEIIKSNNTKLLSSENIDVAKSLLEAAIVRATNESYKAILHRKMGEIAEIQGSQIEALKQYSIAVEYDPKVGCKRSFDRIKKALKRKDT